MNRGTYSSGSFILLFIGIAIVVFGNFAIAKYDMAHSTENMPKEKEVTDVYQIDQNRFRFDRIDALPGYSIMLDAETGKEYIVIDNQYGSSVTLLEK